jgi:ATP-dependent DNA helicase 2 subunit 1
LFGSAPNFTSRRLFIVTDNDDPHAQHKALKSAAAVRAKDLYDLGVLIELFPISRPEKEFDGSKFYDVSLTLSSIGDASQDMWDGVRADEFRT